MLEKTLESPLDSKIKPLNLKGNQPFIFIGRTDAEAEAPILLATWSKSWLIRKDPDVGKDWRQEEKGMTEDNMVGWHHRLNGHEFEQTPGNGEGPGSLACCSPWGYKEWRDWRTTSVLPRLLKINILEYIFLCKKWSRELLKTTKLPSKGYPFYSQEYLFLTPSIKKDFQIFSLF